MGKETGSVTINDLSSLRTEFCGSGLGKRVGHGLATYAYLLKNYTTQNKMSKSGAS